MAFSTKKLASVASSLFNHRWQKASFHQRQIWNAGVCAYSRRPQSCRYDSVKEIMGGWVLLCKSTGFILQPREQLDRRNFTTLKLFSKTRHNWTEPLVRSIMCSCSCKIKTIGVHCQNKREREMHPIRILAWGRLKPVTHYPSRLQQLWSLLQLMKKKRVSALRSSNQLHERSHLNVHESRHQRYILFSHKQIFPVLHLKKLRNPDLTILIKIYKKQL